MYLASIGLLLLPPLVIQMLIKHFLECLAHNSTEVTEQFMMRCNSRLLFLSTKRVSVRWMRSV